jgi:uncharacterized protein YjbI with pentapeptide repeats/beta-lactamase regulating signal transducer with metallopeptidase domain
MNASHVLGNVAATVTAVGLNSLWEDAVVVACVWMFLRTWPRVNAATRYVIWSVALVAAVVVPVATTLPFLSMSPPAAATAAVKASIVPAMHAFPATVAPVRVREIASRGGAPHTDVGAPPILPRLHLQLPLVVAIVLASLWALLALAGAIRFGTGLLRLERLKRDALPLPVEYRDAMLRWNAATKGVRDVRLCVSDQIDVPVAVGLFDSMILIPRELLQRLSADEVDQIALHELAHLRRADDWTNGLTRILLAAFGWNPAVRFAAAQLDLEREVACDDYVLDASGVVRPYAMCLAKMAESSSWPRGPIAAPAVFATRKHLSLRIERLLFAGRATGTNPSFGIAAFAVAGVVLLGCAIGSIAPSVAATVQPAVIPPVVADRVQTVRDVIRYVDVPRTVAAAATAAPSSRPATTLVLKATHASATTHTSATAHPTTAHPIATAHALASMSPFGTKSLRVTVSPKPLSSGTIAVHIPAIDIPSIHLAPIDVTIPKLGLNSAGGRTCTGCDYSGVDWRGRDVRGVAYVGVDLRRANLDNTDFSGGSFQGVDFSHARLRNASFRDARLSGCDFTGADLSGADFTGAHVSGCQFDHAQLTSARIRSIVTGCSGCDFAGANLGGVDLSNVRGADIDFAGADLSHANLSGSSFTDVDFAGAHMGGANVDGAVFTECDLSGTNLTRAALARAKLINTDYPDDR